MKIITEYFLLTALIMFFILYMIQPQPKVIVKYKNKNHSYKNRCEFDTVCTNFNNITLNQ